MLVRVKYKTEQKYVKFTDVTFQNFLKLDESLNSSADLSSCDSDESSCVQINVREKIAKLNASLKTYF
ncbi:hypothetical protein SRHO_G00072470 [Serrasalmus rhombeus]